jgi:hypothetical protein
MNGAGYGISSPSGNLLRIIIYFLIWQRQCNKNPLIRNILQQTFNKNNSIKRIVSFSEMMVNSTFYNHFEKIITKVKWTLKAHRQSATGNTKHDDYFYNKREIDIRIYKK